MSYLIVGASTGLGRALAEEYASAGFDLVLISRDRRDTEPLAAHLRIRFGIAAIALAADLARDDCLTGVDDALAQVSPLRGVLLPVGGSDPDDEIGLSGELMGRLVNSNFLNPCRLLNVLLPRLRGGEVVGFGSVAGTRGRTRNAAYAASKRALMTYFESLRHWAGGEEIAVRFYIPGYLDTNLAFSQDLLFRAADTRRFARRVRADTGLTRTRYFPAYWRFIVSLLLLLPWKIYRRLKI
ncbi:MAG TPA: SDR family NAD(P)-dependent oxidoreductase [Steroidobacteraceae bacterium]|nr:SDR family NAD(P)-dependent oxidoreductase [Steroidobacteraceae bacterium]